MLENDLTKWGLTKTIGRHFFEPTLKLILFPMFLIIGGIVSGNMTDDAVHSEMLLAGFGLGELSVAILSLSILHAFNRNIKSKLEEHFYDGDKEGIQRIIYQQIWLDTLIFLISCIPFLFIDSIYGMLNQNVQIATYAKQFAIPFLPGVYFFTISSLFFDYAEVQRKNTQSFIALLVGMLSLLMFNKFLVGGVGLQLTGVGVASSIGLFLQMIVIVGLNWSDIFGSNRQENVEFCGSDTFFGIGQRFTESAKSCILNLGALWAFELCVLIASYISPQAFAAQVILLQLTIIFMALPYGIGTVAHDLIADSLNFGDTIEAKATGEIFQSFSILVGIISVSIAAIFRNELLNLYTSDVDLISEVNQVWVPFTVFLFCMAINMVISGALSAVSFSMDSWMFSFTQSAQWILAAPVTLIGVFAFDETLKMLWVCLSVFTMIISPITFFLLRNVDYYHAVSIRNKRNEDQRSVELKKFERDEVFNF